MRPLSVFPFTFFPVFILSPRYQRPGPKGEEVVHNGEVGVRVGWGPSTFVTRRGLGEGERSVMKGKPRLTQLHWDLTFKNAVLRKPVMLGI